MALELPSRAFTTLAKGWGYHHISGGASYFVAGEWMSSNLLLKEGLSTPNMTVYVNLIGCCAMWMGSQFLSLDVQNIKQCRLFGINHLLIGSLMRYGSKIRVIPKVTLVAHAITGIFFLVCKPKAKAAAPAKK